MNGDSPIFGVIKDNITRQTFDVPIERQTNHFQIPVDQRAAGITAGNVVRGNKVHRRVHLEY